MPRILSYPLALLGPTILIGAGCRSLPQDRPTVPDGVRTITSIGDRPVSIRAGEPGDSVVADTSSIPPPASPGRTLAGRVVDEDGMPIAGAEVRLAIGGAPAGRTVDAITDEAGRFTLRNLREGSEYTVVAEWEDEEGNLRTSRRRVRAPQSGIQFTLAAPEREQTAREGGRVGRASQQTFRGVDEEGEPDQPPAGGVNLEDLPMPEEADAVARGTRPSERSEPLAEPDMTAEPEVRSGSDRSSGWRRGAGSDERLPRADPDSTEEEMQPILEEEEGVNPLPPAREPGAALSPKVSSSPVDSGGDDRLIREALSSPPEATPKAPAAPSAAPPPEFPGLPGASPVPNMPPDPPVTGSSPAPRDLPPDPGASAGDVPAAPRGARVVPDRDEAPPSPPGVSAPVPSDEGEALQGAEAPAPPPMAAPGDPEPTDEPEAPAAAPDPIEPVSPEREPPAASPTPTAPVPDTQASASKVPARKVRWGDIAPPPERRIAASPIRRAYVPPPGGTREASDRLQVRTADGGIAAASCRFDARKGRLTEFRLPDLEGKPVTMADLDADLILLDFWGTWCGPCVRSVPHLIELQQRYGGGRLKVVGIAYEEGTFEQRAAKVAEAVDHLGINYTVLLGQADGRPCPLQAALNVQAFPTLVLLDRHGHILWRDQGASVATMDRLDRVVAARTSPDVVRR